MGGTHPFRRWWRSRGRHSGLGYWLRFRGSLMLAVCAALFVAGGLVLGWREAYDIVLGIESPADAAVPVVAFVLSLVGWLIVPALVGAVTGYVVSEYAESRRTARLDEVFPETSVDE